jgi:hypothetical protein
LDTAGWSTTVFGAMPNAATTPTKGNTATTKSRVSLLLKTSRNMFCARITLLACCMIYLSFFSRKLNRINRDGKP